MIRFWNSILIIFLSLLLSACLSCRQKASILLIDGSACSTDEGRAMVGELYQIHRANKKRNTMVELKDRLKKAKE